ncbi:putative protease protein, Ulp1 family, partial [Pseudoloma neurophilia]
MACLKILTVLYVGVIRWQVNVDAFILKNKIYVLKSFVFLICCSKYFMVNISDLSFLKLMSNDWFDDLIICKFLDLVVQYANKISDKRCFTFHSHIIDLSREFGPQKYIDLYEDVFNDYDLIFLPIHVPSHWVLYIFDTKSNVLEFYDSNGRQEQKLADVKMFLKYFERTDYKSLKKNVNYQEDSFNCGLYVC